MTEEDMRDLLEQLLAPMILLGDNTLWGSAKMSSRRQKQPFVFEKEETSYYRAYDDCKLALDIKISEYRKHFGDTTKLISF